MEDCYTFDKFGRTQLHFFSIKKSLKSTRLEYIYMRGIFVDINNIRERVY